MADNNTQNGGVGFFGLLTILFIGLKLGGVINWSWWWVLVPLWGPLCLAIFMGFFYTLIKLKCDRKNKDAPHENGN